MQQTTNYNLLIPEGTDIVNPLTQVNPNFQTIDSAMFANKQATIGTASEVVTGTVHAIIRNNADSDVFRFTATGAWTAGDTMTLDGQQVTVHLSDGTIPASNSYIIGAEVLAMVNGSLVTLAISTTPPAQGVTSFNTRTGAVMPAASDYDGSMIDYDNTTSGLNSTDVQGAIDEISAVPHMARTLIVDHQTNGSVSYDFSDFDYFEFFISLGGATGPSFTTGITGEKYFRCAFGSTYATCDLRTPGTVTYSIVTGDYAGSTVTLYGVKIVR